MVGPPLCPLPILQLGLLALKPSSGLETRRGVVASHVRRGCSQERPLFTLYDGLECRVNDIVGPPRTLRGSSASLALGRRDARLPP